MFAQLISSLIQKVVQFKKQKETQKHTLKNIVFTLVSLMAIQVFVMFSIPTAEATITPAVLLPETLDITTAKPIISGVSPNDTLIEIYIDDILIGHTKSENDFSGIGSFSWKLQQPLSPGEHSIKVRAVDIETQEASTFSESKIVFVVPFGTPTLRIPDKLTLTKPFTFIEGVAHNNSTVNVFIDGIQRDTFTLKEDPSGTVGFNYSLTTRITTGTHTLYVQAEDTDGKLSLPSKAKIITIVDYPAPTIVSPASLANTLEQKLTITGIAFNNSKIHIYIDGEVEEVVPVKNDPSGIGNFFYTIKKPLERGTYHQIYTLAQAEDGRISNPSNKVDVFIEHYFVPPTLLAIKGDFTKPTVTGLAHNDSTINIFVNDKLDTTITPENDPSGTLYFETKLSKKLAGGVYKITAQAFNPNQKPSRISQPKYHRITLVSEEEKPLTVAKQEKERSEKLAQEEEGKVSTKDEEAGKVNSEEEKKMEEPPKEGEEQKEEAAPTEEEKEETGPLKSSEPTNWPLMLGLIILIGLALLFIIWYLSQKRRLLNEGIDKLFSDVDETGPKQDTLFDTPREEQDLGVSMMQEEETVTMQEEPTIELKTKEEVIKTKPTEVEEKKSKQTRTRPADDFDDIPPPPPPL